MKAIRKTMSASLMLKLALSAVAAFFVARGSAVAADEASRPLYMVQPRLTELEVQNATSCNITSTDSCGKADLSNSSRTLIYPGGNTSCLWGQPYAFIYYPGHGDQSNNLLINFQGGGACFIDNVTNIPGTCSRNARKINVLCTTDVVPDEEVGIFADSNPRNPYNKWSKVSILYCSGDLHAGNTTRHYSSKNGSTNKVVEDESYQFGFNNAYTALKWTIANFPSPTKLVVAGQSAGALGAHAWSDYLLTKYSNVKDSDRSVILDSYALAVLPANQGVTLKAMGICDAMGLVNLFTAEELQNCKSGSLWFNTVANRVHQKYKDTPFVAVQSKFDEVQKLFYTDLSFTAKLGLIPNSNLSIPSGVNASFPSGVISNEEFYNQSGVVLQYFTNNSNNFLYYLVNSMQHVYMTRATFTTDGMRSEPEKPLVAAYLEQFPVTNGTSAVSFCEDDPKFPCQTSWNKTFTQGAQQSDTTSGSNGGASPTPSNGSASPTPSSSAKPPSSSSVQRSTGGSGASIIAWVALLTTATMIVL